MTFRDLLLKKPIVIFDGAMGTELQKRGLKPGESPENLNFTAPEKVAEVIRAYAEAGSDVISTNTFGANRYKLSEIGRTPSEVIAKAAEISKSALSDFPGVLISQDIGPLGQLLKPMGTLDFDDAYGLFAEQVIAGAKAGVDLIVLQTFADLLEMKAAILAVKENSDLPVICSMTFEVSGRTFTGCPVSAFAVTASGLGADAVGVNCSNGPRELLPIVRELMRFTDLPVMAKPNAGLPDPVTGAYGLGAEDFAEDMKQYAGMGVKILGGCCGTTPRHIELLSSVKAVSPQPSTENHQLCVSSGTKTVVIDRPRTVGERINPTGKRLFKEALKNSDFDYVLKQAVEQAAAGADILDVNVGLPGLDERAAMTAVCEKIQSVCDLPLQIDSTKPEVLEAALRRYCGKPIVNSVNGDSESLSAVLPLVKKYGAAVIGLTLDGSGIPETAEGRLAIAERILNAALGYGIRREDVIIDCLTLTVSAEPKAAVTTLETVRLVKSKLGLKTALGVSNVSFGLPNRELINSAFLTMALQCGLDLPIINPCTIGAVKAYNLLAGFDENAAEYVKSYSGAEKEQPSAAADMTLEHAVANGLKSEAAVITAKLLETTPPMDIVNGCLIPALDKIGEEFEKGAVFLPQLMLAAGAAGECFNVIKKTMPSSTDNGKTIILATVKGDIHDIGKNIVKTLLENYGYRVIDLGRDVEPEVIADRAEAEQIRLVGLSALMTTTLGAMADTARLLRERGVPCKIMVGGAVLNADYAKSIGADYYAKDAKGAVQIAREVWSL